MQKEPPWKPAGWIITLGYYFWFNTISYWKAFIRLSKESGCIYILAIDPVSNTKKNRILSVLQWFQICIVLTPSDWCILYLLLRICLHLCQYDMMYLSYTQIAFLRCLSWMLSNFFLQKWLYEKDYWPTRKRFLSWYVWSLFCSVGGSHPLHK